VQPSAPGGARKAPGIREEPASNGLGDDISLRMHQAGWEVWCVPEAAVVHLEQRSSVRPFSTPWLRHLESLGKFVWKHKGLAPKPRARLQ
jgi:GT2 family glycosyltransferase